MRTPLVVGNWKMNGSRALVAEFVQGLRAEIEFLAGVDIGLCPPSIFATDMGLALGVGAEEAGAIAIMLGVQNVSTASSGASTGELASGMLTEFGCELAILGHSERRAMFGETSNEVAEKALRALEHEVTPIVCVGETLEQREAGEVESVIASQLQPVLAALTADQLEKIVVAYEPVWAIGSGLIPKESEILDIVKFIKNKVKGSKVLYGGSVNTKNINVLNKINNLDGFLIGGASQNANNFIDIIKKTFN